MTALPPYHIEPGCEVLQSRIALGKRLLVSHTEAGRLLESGELKPIGRGAKASHYRTADLDRLRLRAFEKVREKFSHLRADERAFLRQIGAECSALAAGRAEPTSKDRATGEILAMREEVRTGLGVLSTQLKSFSAGIEAVQGMVASLMSAKSTTTRFF